MLNTSELLALVKSKKIRNSEVAKVLGVNPSRVTEIYKGARVVKLDEAARLVAAFGLEDGPSLKFPDPILTIIIKHIAAVLGKPIEDEDGRLEELSADLRDFTQFQADPAMRSSLEAAEGFFRALRARRGA